MSQPVIAQKGPFAVELEAGKQYALRQIFQPAVLRRLA